jgi:hypothetical protein
VDKKQLIAWLVPILARGLAWVFAAWLGVEAVKASDLGGQAANAFGALAIVGFSVWTSLAGRKKLLATDPLK